MNRPIITDSHIALAVFAVTVLLLGLMLWSVGQISLLRSEIAGTTDPLVEAANRAIKQAEEAEEERDNALEAKDDALEAKAYAEDQYHGLHDAFTDLLDEYNTQAIYLREALIE